MIYSICPDQNAKFIGISPPCQDIDVNTTGQAAASHSQYALAMTEPPMPAAVANDTDFPVVGIGASAGGLEAFDTFLRACPANTGMAFVFISHLAPDHESLLAEMIQRATSMPVAEASHQLAVLPDHIYIIPPDHDITICQGMLLLSPPKLPHAQRMPIDTFLRSLALAQGPRCAGIILSGTATDGTLGLQAIHAAGGTCLVQDPASAKYNGMPQSAIRSGAASQILPVARMPAMLQQRAQTAPYRLADARVEPGDAGDLTPVLLELRRHTGHDFAQYKKSTIGRRIARRMMQHQIDSATTYARYIKENSDESKQLFHELLINVTCFFRDADAFTVLKESILPPLLAQKSCDATFRVWVAGCSTGEEAYSIAMVLAELQDELRASHGRELAIQIYATDLDDEAITYARAGRYPATITGDLSAERLQRFFILEPSGYRVSKSLRDMVIFAVQSIIKDPPFTRLDLLSCRNLLIYLEAEQQKRLTPLFHYALNPGGVLFLSSSESIANAPHLFYALDRKWKFYRALHAVAPVPFPLPHVASPVTAHQHTLQEKAPKTMYPETNLGELARNTLLQAYAPASVITDTSGTILYVYGDTGSFLRPAPGQASLNVMDMAREGLEHPLREIYRQAASQAPIMETREVAIKAGRGFLRVSLCVRQLPAQTVIAQADTGTQVLLLSFQEIPEAYPSESEHGRSSSANGLPASMADAERITYLERELAYAKESERVTVEKHQLFNLELKSANEDLQSTNEELQSSNEELMTSKEELQSLNEEMININSELSSKIEQLSDMQNDMKNLLDSIYTGTLFLDHQLLIKRFTPQAVKVFRLVASDIGRPLADIKSNLAADDLLAELQTVLDTLIPIEREVIALDGEWYLARMQPYRTLDNVIAGVVLTLTAVTRFKRTSEAAQLAQELAEGIVNTVREPLIVLDPELRAVSAGRAFYDYFAVSEADTVGRKIFELGAGQWNIPALRQLLEEILPQDHVFEGYTVEHDFPGIGRRRLILNARRIVSSGGHVRLILLAMVSIEILEP